MNEKAAKLARRAARASGTMKKGDALMRSVKREWDRSTHAKRGEYTLQWRDVAKVEREPRGREYPLSRSLRARMRRAVHQFRVALYRDIKLERERALAGVT